MKPASSGVRRYTAHATILLLTGLRLIVASRLPLSFDEAYYWRWSRALSLSYPDHPPMVAWLIRLGTNFAGPTELGVRLPFVLLSALGMWLSYQLARSLGLRTGWATVAMIVASCLPAVAVGSVLATPDLPLGICTLGVALLLVKMLGQRPSPRLLVFLMLTMAAAFYTKLSAVLLLGLAAAAATTIPALRGQLLNRRAALAWTGSAALLAPYISADLTANAGATFFQLSRLDPSGWSGNGASLAARYGTHLLEILGGQLGLITPFVLFLAVVAAHSGPRTAKHWILQLGWLIPVGMTAAAALFTHPEQNWAAIGHPLAGILAVCAIAEPRPDRARPWLRRMGRHPKPVAAAVLASVILPTLLIHVHALSPFLPLPPERDPIGKLHGFQGLAPLCREMNTSFELNGILADNYGIASEVAWAKREATGESELPVASTDRAWAQGLPPGRWLLLDEHDDIDGRTIAAGCKIIKELGTEALLDPAGRVVRQVRVSLGFGCK